MPLTHDEIKRGRELEEDLLNSYSETTRRRSRIRLKDWLYKHGASLMKTSEYHAKLEDENKILVSQNQCLKGTLRSNGKLNEIESTRIEQLWLENKRLKENHAKDVHAAYVEGFQHSHARRYMFLCNGWKFSQANKKLEGSK